MVTADRLSRARAGDGEAFRELAESHRRELQVHCYRMLGSFQDAEDAVQETMLAAWQGIGGFAEEHGSLRTWLQPFLTRSSKAPRLGVRSEIRCTPGHACPIWERAQQEAAAEFGGAEVQELLIRLRLTGGSERLAGIRTEVDH
jgi:hypothetical protein